MNKVRAARGSRKRLARAKTSFTRKQSSEKRQTLKRKKDYPDHYYVVYHKKVGRTEPGVHCCRVSFDGNVAFVHPPESRSTADMVSKASVFKDKDDAHRCYAGAEGGAWKWVLWHEYKETVEIFRARVRSQLQKRHGGWTDYVTSIVKEDGTVITGRYDTKVFDTEKEAFEHLAFNLKNTLKSALEDLHQADARVAALDKLEARMRKLGVKPEEAKES